MLQRYYMMVSDLIVDSNHNTVALYLWPDKRDECDKQRNESNRATAHGMIDDDRIHSKCHDEFTMISEWISDLIEKYMVGTVC